MPKTTSAPTLSSERTSDCAPVRLSAGWAVMSGAFQRSRGKKEPLVPEHGGVSASAGAAGALGDYEGARKGEQHRTRVRQGVGVVKARDGCPRCLAKVPPAAGRPARFAAVLLLLLLALLRLRRRVDREPPGGAHRSQRRPRPPRARRRAALRPLPRRGAPVRRPRVSPRGRADTDRSEGVAASRFPACARKPQRAVRSSSSPRPAEVDRLCLPYDTGGWYSLPERPGRGRSDADRWRTGGRRSGPATSTPTARCCQPRGRRIPAVASTTRPRGESQCPDAGRARPGGMSAAEHRSLGACLPNPWPLPRMVERDAEHVEPLAPPYEP
jgi:hypothetical protein